MTSEMVALAQALINAGCTVSPNKVGSNTVFCDGYGIFESLAGNGTLQARYVYDKDQRFTIGHISDPPEKLAANFVAGCLDPWA